MFFTVWVSPYHFFSKTAGPIELTFYMDLSCVKAHRTKQNGIMDMRTFAVFSIFLKTTEGILLKFFTCPPHNSLQ